MVRIALLLSVVVSLSLVGVSAATPPAVDARLTGSERRPPQRGMDGASGSKARRRRSATSTGTAGARGSPTPSE